MSRKALASMGFVLFCVLLGSGSAFLLRDAVSEPVYWGIGAVLVITVSLAWRRFASRFAGPS